MGLVILLILIGLLFLVAEILIIPGIGVAGFLGLGSLGAACWFAFTGIGTTAGVIVTTIACILVVVMLVIVLRGKTWTRFALNTNIEAKAGKPVNVRVGDKGVTVTRMAPAGTVLFGNKTVEARSVDGMLDPGTEVTVILLEDNKIYVKQIINEF